MNILVDKREKTPWSFKRMGVALTSVSLQTGDYQLPGAFNAVVERKSLQDLVQTIGGHKERFLKECCRLSQFRKRIIIIEGTVQQIVDHAYIGRVKPETIFETLARIECVMGVQIMWAVKPQAAQRMAFEWFEWAEMTQAKSPT